MGFKPTGDGARKIERKILKMQRKLVGLRKCVEELVAHERIFMKTESKKERARARAEDDAERMAGVANKHAARATSCV